MPSSQPRRDSDPIQPWDSDHTALVHVLWAAGIKGAEADELASKIMQSKWMKAVRYHEAERAAKDAFAQGFGAGGG